MKNGDVIQITNEEHHWFPALLVVDEVKPWGVQAYAIIPVCNDVPASCEVAFIRLETGDFEFIGEAIVTGEGSQVEEENINAS